MEKLFSYGTLQFKNVQLDTFGRILNGTKEKLLGYKTKRLKITDDSVINSSHTDNHQLHNYLQVIIHHVLFQITALQLNLFYFLCT